MQPGPFIQPDVADAAVTVGNKNVYGINWQAQKNSVADAGSIVTDFWVDDVYFLQ